MASKMSRRDKLFSETQKKARLTFGVEQKCERATFDERAYRVREHSVVVTQEKIVVNVS